MVHDLADLLRVRFGQRAAKDSEVLAVDEHQPAVDRAVAGHHAVARNLLVRHAEVVAAMLDEHVPFFEALRIKQEIEAFARRQLALGVLGVDALLSAAEPRGRALLLELVQ